MKKQLLLASIGYILLIPFYTHAEETFSLEATSTIVESTQETEDEDVLASSTPKNFTTCSQEAIEVRDTSIATSRTIYNSAMTDALKDRKNKEKAAMAITNENKKKDAIKVSVNTYKNLVKNAQNNLTEAREEAWKTFEEDIEACRELEKEEVASNEGALDAYTEPAEGEPKTIKETIKEQFEALRSLFN